MCLSSHQLFKSARCVIDQSTCVFYKYYKIIVNAADKFYQNWFGQFHFSQSIRLYLYPHSKKNHGFKQFGNFPLILSIDFCNYKYMFTCYHITQKTFIPPILIVSSFIYGLSIFQKIKGVLYIQDLYSKPMENVSRKPIKKQKIKQILNLPCSRQFALSNTIPLC